MKSEKNPVTLNILGKEYKVMCVDEEKNDLIRSAQQLDQEMRAIRLTGKVSGAERVAVLAALNLSHELMQTKKNSTSANPTLNERLNKMYLKIETALKSV